MYTIEVQNLDETIASIAELDAQMAKALKRKIREVVKPTLAKARSYAHVGACPTGKYASSLSLKTHANGVKFVSTDEAGGVKEFAHQGALILSGPRAGRRAGVPIGSEPPRALLKAILQDEEHIVEQVNEAVVETCELVNRG